jgi:chaperonin GroEL
MKQDVVLGQDANKGLIRGINILGDAVSSTLGPNGKTVVIERHDQLPLCTQDGVSIASSIELEDPIENLGVSLIKQVSQQANAKAGDGTTTATVLAQAMVNAGERFVSKGVNANAIKLGMEYALNEFQERLKKDYSHAIVDDKEINNVARISANNDNVLGDVIADALKEVGVNGSVTPESSANNKTYYKVITGLTMERRGWMSPHFVNNQSKQSVELERPLVYISERVIDSELEVMPILALAKQQQPERSVVFIGKDVTGNALSTILTNHSQSVIKATCVKAPFFGENQQKVLMDIAALTGAQINNSATTIVDTKTYTLDMLGGCDKFVQTYHESTILEGHGDEANLIEYLEGIEGELKYANDNNESQQIKDFLQERLAKLSNGVAQVFVGAGSEAELKEKKDRLEDALYATKAALEDGVSVGGGTTALRIKKEMEDWKPKDNSDFNIGINIFIDCLSAPIRQILKNAIANQDQINEIIYKVQANESKTFGYNVYTKEFGDMVEMGVIDPTRVTSVAMTSAVSIAALVLTTECLITNVIK